MTQHLSNVVLADDDPDDQEMLAERFVLHCPDIIFKFFKDGEEVSHYLENCPIGELPALLILDYKMPIRTGVDVLKTLHKDNRFNSIHKVVWSTSGNREYVAQCLSYGAEKYFTKPQSVQELDTMIVQMSLLIK